MLWEIAPHVATFVAVVGLIAVGMWPRKLP